MRVHASDSQETTRPYAASEQLVYSAFREQFVLAIPDTLRAVGSAVTL